MEFILRSWRMEDAQDLAKYANNKHVFDNLRDGFPHPYTLEDAKSFIRLCLEADPLQLDFRAIVVDSSAVGSIGLTRGVDVHKRSAELGYWLAEPFWGQGITTDAVMRICADAFAQTDLLRIFASPYGYNTGSCRVLEKAGFVLEGTMRKYAVKNGVVVDGYLYALVKD